MGAHLDQVGVPCISRDSEIIVALFLQSGSAWWFTSNMIEIQGVPFSSNARRRGLDGVPTVSWEAIKAPILVYSRYFEERTKRPDIVDAEGREKPKRSAKSSGVEVKEKTQPT